VAFVGGIGALAMKSGMPWYVAIIIMIALGLVIGAWHGFWVAYVGVPGFVTTLGGMLIFRGLATVVAGESIPVSDSTFRAISISYVPTIFVGDLALTALIAGLIAIVLVIWLQLRKRAKAVKNGLSVQPMSFVVLKCVVATLFIAYFTYLLASAGNASQGGIPIVLVIIGVLVGV
ncbi:sugar ABC transporter permease, partial [Faecalicatena contorta]|nr:sugar ABC transporter permease [Faecalicatena contorta]